MVRRHKSLVVMLAFFTLASPRERLLAQDVNNPTGRAGLILIDKRGNHVRFFDQATFTELSSFSTGSQAAHEVAISPDHRTAYIPIYGDGVINNNPHPGNALLVVDLATRQVTGTIDLSPCVAPHGIQIDRDGMLYLVCDISRTLVVVNPRARKVEYTVDVEGTGHWLALLPDASKAYVSHQGGAAFISVLDLKARRMTGRIPVTASGGITASPDGRRVYAMTGGRAGPPVVTVIDVATDSIVDRVGLQGHSQPGYKLRLSADGQTLITCGYDGGGVESMVNILAVSDLHGAQKVLRAGKGTMGFAFAPDGRTVLLGNDGDGTVTVADLQGGVVTTTFKGGVGIENLSYY
jgi:DNA-binding beta-propeller fold protein YncE